MGDPRANANSTGNRRAGGWHAYGGGQVQGYDLVVPCGPLALPTGGELGIGPPASVWSTQPRGEAATVEPSMEQPSVEDSVYVVSDSANLFSGAQLIDGKRNMEIKVNLATILPLIDENRPIKHRVVVASFPERSNRMWRYFEQRRYHIIYKPEESQVAAELAAQIRAIIAREPPPCSRCHLIFVTGDGNAHAGQQNFPELLTSALQRGWSVELVCWRSCLNPVYETLCNDYPRTMRLRFLDAHRADITFFKPRMAPPSTASPDRQPLQQRQPLPLGLSTRSGPYHLPASLVRPTPSPVADMVDGSGYYQVVNYGTPQASVLQQQQQQLMLQRQQAQQHQEQLRLLAQAQAHAQAQSHHAKPRSGPPSPYSASSGGSSSSSSSIQSLSTSLGLVRISSASTSGSSSVTSASPSWPQSTCASTKPQSIPVMAATPVGLRMMYAPPSTRASQAWAGSDSPQRPPPATSGSGRSLHCHRSASPQPSADGGAERSHRWARDRAWTSFDGLAGGNLLNGHGQPVHGHVYGGPEELGLGVPPGFEEQAAMSMQQAPKHHPHAYAHVQGHAYAQQHQHQLGGRTASPSVAYSHMGGGPVIRTPSPISEPERPGWTDAVYPERCLPGVNDWPRGLRLRSDELVNVQEFAVETLE